MHQRQHNASSRIDRCLRYGFKPFSSSPPHTHTLILDATVRGSSRGCRRFGRLPRSACHRNNFRKSFGSARILANVGIGVVECGLTCTNVIRRFALQLLSQGKHCRLPVHAKDHYLLNAVLLIPVRIQKYQRVSTSQRINFRSVYPLTEHDQYHEPTTATTAATAADYTVGGLWGGVWG